MNTAGRLSLKQRMLLPVAPRTLFSTSFRDVETRPAVTMKTSITNNPPACFCFHPGSATHPFACNFWQVKSTTIFCSFAPSFIFSLVMYHKVGLLLASAFVVLVASNPLPQQSQPDGAFEITTSFTQ